MFERPKGTLDDDEPPPVFGEGASAPGAEPAPPDPAAQFLEGASDWDVAVRYHELKAALGKGPALDVLREISVDAVLRQARTVMGASAHPSLRLAVPIDQLEPDDRVLDLALDETLDAVEWAGEGLPEGSSRIWMEVDRPRRLPMILAVDTSLSMTGSKLALTAVALAVVLLQFPEDPLGIVAFENEAFVIKKPEERLPLRSILERFLDVPAEGYTHLEAGLIKSLELAERMGGSARGRPPSVVLMSDAKYTAGRDPAYLGDRFRHLLVVKMGPERTPLSLCRELARRGSGALREVWNLRSLPEGLYGVVKDILRGRSR
ncbi:MAG: VWA domain-containing protein [Bdellovibrionales bacterium]|nr:VWA domain-containing protein [Bdellovibrionales bacterium]